MTRRGGFGSYMNAPGMTQIDRVIATLQDYASGRSTERQCGVQLVGFGLDRTQAAALISCCRKVVPA